jgi:hypothetical protein
VRSHRGGTAPVGRRVRMALAALERGWSSCKKWCRRSDPIAPRSRGRGELKINLKNLGLRSSLTGREETVVVKMAQGLSCSRGCGNPHGERWGRSTLSVTRPKGRKRWRKLGPAGTTTRGEKRGDEELLRGRDWRREGADGSYSRR